MKYFFILILGFSFVLAQSQNLYLAFKSVDTTNDSLVNSYQSKHSFKDFKSLKNYADKILINLQQKGYFNLRNKSIEALNDTLFSQTIQLNKRYRIIQLKNYSKLSKVFEELSPHINIDNLENLLNSMLNKLSQEGKPFSQVKFEDITFSQKDTVKANLVLSQSNKRTLDEIVIRGYDNFPTAFLKNYSKLKTGLNFNREKLIEKSNRIEELPFVNQTKTPQVQFTPDSTKLFLYLERAQANSFDGFIGFNNTEENNFQVNGNIDLKLINNFNSGEEINLQYKNDGNAQEWFDVGVRLPYLFKTKFSIEARLNLFKQDSTFSNSTQQFKVDYQIGQQLNLGFKTTFQTSTNLLDSLNLQEDIQDYKKSQYGIEMVYQTAKSYSKLFLSNQYINLSFGLGQRKTSNHVESQEFINLKLRQILKLSKRQYAFVGLNAGYLNTNRFISNELFRFGGINSMRGFAENRFFTNFYGTLQTEYRFILGSNLYIHSVLDYGFYENEIDNFNENLYSIGMGFGLETQAGILRLIFANGGSSNQNIAFRNTQIHLKFISVF